MKYAGPENGKLGHVVEWRVTAAAIVVSLAYAAFVMLWASPVSFYTLDDPYIHMALAENIARGSFGVNLGEVANPSSSIIWPWIMAGFEKVGLMLWAPLLINIASFVASLRIIFPFCLKRIASDGAGIRKALILVGLGFLTFNLFGVIFTGMEHSLHVFLSLAAVSRLVDGRYDWLTFVALVLGPLVRFEAAIVLALGVGAALADRKWPFAGLAIAVSVALVGGYAVWLSSLELPILPSSVLTKSAASSSLVDGGGGMIAGLLATFSENIRAPSALMFGLMAVGLVYAALKRTGRDRVLALGLIAVLLLIMMLGRADSYARYEVYALSVLAIGLVHLLQGELRQLLVSPARALILGGGLCVAGWGLGPYVLLTTPQAARNIDRQQHQMHRFVVECWKQPIAINDLGWVSFRNDSYVLDLYGLGSEAARKARGAGEPDWMNRLTDSARVNAVMIYPGWFQELPKNWTLVGELSFSGINITPSKSSVVVYATHPEADAPLRACLQEIAETLPSDASIHLAE